MTVIVTKDAINLREKLSELDKETGIKGEELMRADTSAEAREALQLDQQLFTDFESTGIDDNATSTVLTVSDTGIDVIGTGSIGTTTGNLTIYSSSAGKHGLGFYTGAVYSVNNTGALVDNAVDLGNAIYRFKDIYASNGTIQTSDANEKQDVDILSDAEQRVAVACKGLLRKFRWKDAVEEKGEDARIHFGIIAQDLQAAFTAEGLDAGRYAMFIQNTWTDEETGEEYSRMGVRYSELLAFIIAA